MKSPRERWEHLSEWPLTAAAVAFLAAYAWPVIDPALPPEALRLCQVVTFVTWLVFVADYVIRLRLSRDRRRFVVTHLPDLAVVLLPLLRPLRLLRLVSLLAVLNRHAGSSLRGRVALYVAGSFVLVLFVSALAVLDAERGQPGAVISSLADALWWSATTVTTVGYGDLYPVTGEGRIVAVGLMISGIALVGIVTASLASWLIERIAEVEEESQSATRHDVHRLQDEIASLRADLSAALERPVVREPTD